MTRMFDINQEPVAIVNAVRLVLLAAMTFGLNLTNVQLVASMIALEAVLTLFTRSKTTSPATLQNMTPSTLAAAQDATQPVKDATRKLPMVLLPLMLAGSMLVGCGGAGKAPVNLNPQATAAWYGTQAIMDLDLLRNVAIDANKQVPPLISTATTHQIVDYHESSIKVIHAIPLGWKSTVAASLVELMNKLPANERLLLSPYLNLVVAVIKGVIQ